MQPWLKALQGAPRRQRQAPRCECTGDPAKCCACGGAGCTERGAGWAVLSQPCCSAHSEGDGLLLFPFLVFSVSLAWVSCSWRIGSPGPPATPGAPFPHGFLSCQAISLHRCLGRNAAKGLSAGAAVDFTSDIDPATCHQLGRCFPLEGTVSL